MCTGELLEWDGIGEDESLCGCVVVGCGTIVLDDKLVDEDNDDDDNDDEDCKVGLVIGQDRDIGYAAK